MPKVEWGVKRTCPTTGKRFYDLNRNPIVSPYTGEIVQIEAMNRREAMAADLRMAKKPGRGPADDALEDDDLLVAEDDADVDVDDDLLEEEADDETVGLDDLTDVPGGDEEP